MSWGFFACGCTAGVSLLVVALLGFLCLWLHHLSLSLGRQNATLGSFTGDGSGRFGLESCWGSAVSEPRSTELLSDEGATSTQLLSKPVACPAGVSLLVVALLGFLCLWLHCGCIAGVSLLVVESSFSFFRPSERNARQFYGGWFWQVWA